MPPLSPKISPLFLSLSCLKEAAHLSLSSKHRATMNGYSKFREGSENHTAQTSSLTLEEEECQDQKPPSRNPSTQPREPDMRPEDFVLKRNHTTSSQRFASNNSDLKNMMRRAFSTRKAYWRIEDDAGNGEVGDGAFEHEHELERDHEARGGHVEDKKKKRIFKRWRKIFHF